MKRGSSDAAKRHSAHSASQDVGSLGSHKPTADSEAYSLFPAATSLFSPDVSSKMASDLLIRLSEATQKIQMDSGNQDEPGVALSPDGPGPSPEPPSLTHTPDGNTLASDLLRKLAERQEVDARRLKEEEEEPMEIEQSPPITEEKEGSSHFFLDEGRRLLPVPGLTERLYPAFAATLETAPFPVKVEDFEVAIGGTNPFVSGVKLEGQEFASGVAAAEEQFGVKLADQCIRAVLWQDMSVNLASTLLHQLSEKVSKSTNQQPWRTTPPTWSSPVSKTELDRRLLPSPLQTTEDSSSAENQTNLGREPSYFFRCHVCGFETEGQRLFRGHMTEHRRWERGAFTLHCCACEFSTNQETEMRSHVETHSTEMRVSVAVADAATPPEHRCRICQRSFPGQRELLSHFQGHRQGNQYRCDRCGHLTRTANKLVEHVRVHTGERPFTCDFCPYSAKRRDSLRLHCKVKHGDVPARLPQPRDVHTHRSYVRRLHTARAPPLGEGWAELSPLLPITTLLSLRSPSSSSRSSSSSAKHSFLRYLGLASSSSSSF